VEEELESLIGKHYYKILSIIISGYIISRYISNPHLINGFKYDLRVYVLVTSFNPLTIFMFNNGSLNRISKIYNIKI